MVHQEFKMRLFDTVRPPVYLVGVKHTDSKSRAMWDWSRPKWIYNHIAYSPVWFWNTNDIMDYLKSRNIPISSCYEKFGHSGNCMYCPFHTVLAIRKTVNDHYWGPKILSALSRLRNEWGKREYRKWAKYMVKPLTTWL